MSEGKMKSDNLEPKPSNPVDWSDLICAVCELGGEMICCDGKCLRSFHPLCINLDEENIPEDSPFLCIDCENGLHRCFYCKKFDVEIDLIKCSLPFCGKFYHKEVSILHIHFKFLYQPLFFINVNLVNLIKTVHVNL